MTKEGRLARGKENYEFKNRDGSIGKFLDNSETMAYIETLKDKPKEESKPKDVKPNK